jgi:hypothetical protein
MSQRSSGIFVLAASVIGLSAALSVGVAQPTDNASKHGEPNVGQFGVASDASPEERPQKIRPALALPTRDPFGLPASNAKPPAPAPSPAREAAPKVEPVPPPPLPFVFLGRVDINEASSAFLVEGNNVMLVRPGDTLSNSYVVDRITQSEIVFIHTPTQKRQSLASW